MLYIARATCGIRAVFVAKLGPRAPGQAACHRPLPAVSVQRTSGMPSLPHVVVTPTRLPKRFCSSASGSPSSPASGGKCSPRLPASGTQLPVVRVVGQPSQPLRELTGKSPTLVGAPTLPVICTMPQSLPGPQTSPTCKAWQTPTGSKCCSGLPASGGKCNPELPASPGLPASGGSARLRVVRCVGLAEGQSKRKYEAVVSLAEISKLGPQSRRLKKKNYTMLACTC